MIIIEDINGVRYTLNPEHVVIADTGAKAKRQGRVCSVHCRDYPQAIEITRTQADAIERHWNAADIRERQITPADCMADLELVERMR